MRLLPVLDGETPETVVSAGRPVREPTKSPDDACVDAAVASATLASIYSVEPSASLLRDEGPVRLQYVATPPNALAIEAQTWSLLSSVTPATVISKLTFS